MKKTIPHEELLRPTQVADLINVRRGTISYAMKKGLIAVVQVGPVKLITKSEALRYKNNRPMPGRKKNAPKSMIIQKNKNT